MIETVDESNRRLDYLPAVQVAFDGTDLDVELLNGLDPGDGAIGTLASDAADKIEALFRHLDGKVHAYIIRELLRKALGDANATTVRPSGGVYFVMRTRLDQVDAIEQLAGGLCGVDFTVVPLINDKKRAEMIRRAYEAETVGELDALTAEITELLRGEPVTSRKAAALQAQLQDTIARTKEYEQLLSTQMSSAEFRITNVRNQIVRLFKHTK